MRLAAQGRCTRKMLRDEMGREVGWGFRIGDICTLMAVFMSMYGKNHHNIVKQLASN